MGGFGKCCKTYEDSSLTQGGKVICWTKRLMK